MNHTSEEVRAEAASFARVFNERVASMLTAYADSIERAQAEVTDAMVELAVRAHDREEAGQKGEPDPWADEFPEPYRSERMTAMRLAITAALAAQGQGNPVAWLVVDAKGKRFTIYNRELAEAIKQSAEQLGSTITVKGVCEIPPQGWYCTRQPGHEGPCAAWENTPPTPPASPAGVPDGWVLVPARFGVSKDAWEAAQFAFGGPGTGEDEEFMDCTAWIGEIENDDGSKTHGIHIQCDECPEEGSITLAEFAAAALPEVVADLTGGIGLARFQAQFDDGDDE